MLDAGQFHHRIRVERQKQVPDGYGNVLGQWTTLCTFAAAFRPQYGRESVEAGRLEATMRGVVTIRYSRAAASITAEDRIVMLRTPYAGMVMQIRSIVPSPDRAEIGLVVEQGVAT